MLPTRFRATLQMGLPGLLLGVLLRKCLAHLFFGIDRGFRRLLSFGRCLGVGFRGCWFWRHLPRLRRGSVCSLAQLRYPSSARALLASTSDLARSLLLDHGIPNSISHQLDPFPHTQTVSEMITSQQCSMRVGEIGYLRYSPRVQLLHVPPILGGGIRFSGGGIGVAGQRGQRGAQMAYTG